MHARTLLFPGRPVRGLVVAALAAAGGAAAALMSGRVVVSGESMSPAIEAGDRLLFVRTCRVAPGHVAVFADPEIPRACW